jgi:hypothetical protein
VNRTEADFLKFLVMGSGFAVPFYLRAATPLGSLGKAAKASARPCPPTLPLIKKRVAFQTAVPPGGIPRQRIIFDPFILYRATSG